MEIHAHRHPARSPPYPLQIQKSRQKLQVKIRIHLRLHLRLSKILHHHLTHKTPLLHRGLHIHQRKLHRLQATRLARSKIPPKTHILHPRAMRRILQKSLAGPKIGLHIGQLPTRSGALNHRIEVNIALIIVLLQHRYQVLRRKRNQHIKIRLRTPHLQVQRHLLLRSHRAFQLKIAVLHRQPRGRNPHHARGRIQRHIRMKLKVLMLQESSIPALHHIQLQLRINVRSQQRICHPKTPICRVDVQLHIHLARLVIVVNIQIAQPYLLQVKIQQPPGLLHPIQLLYPLTRSQRILQIVRAILMHHQIKKSLLYQQRLYRIVAPQQPYQPKTHVNILHLQRQRRLRRTKLINAHIFYLHRYIREIPKRVQVRSPNHNVALVLLIHRRHLRLYNLILPQVHHQQRHRKQQHGDTQQQGQGSEPIFSGFTQRASHRSQTTHYALSGLLILHQASPAPTPHPAYIPESPLADASTQKGDPTRKPNPQQRPLIICRHRLGPSPAASAYPRRATITPAWSAYSSQYGAIPPGVFPHRP